VCVRESKRDVVFFVGLESSSTINAMFTFSIRVKVTDIIFSDVYNITFVIRYAGQYLPETNCQYRFEECHIHMYPMYFIEISKTTIYLCKKFQFDKKQYCRFFGESSTLYCCQVVVTMLLNCCFRWLTTKGNILYT